MTIMGMAASQARFLGLTARKSNTEYQGQQVNQQRTALANESANIYSQMSNLEVPVPPSTTDFYETKYVLDNSAFGNNSDFEIVNVTKSSSGTNEYTVSLGYEESKSVGKTTTSQVYGVSRALLVDETDKYSYTIDISGSDNVVYNPKNVPYGSEETASGTTKYTQKIEANKIYDITQAETATGGDIKATDFDGYTEALQALKDQGYDPDVDGDIYFYRDNSGKNCYMTGTTLKNMTSELQYIDDEAKPKEGESYICQSQFAFSYKETNEYTINAQATIESSDSGRYTSIYIHSGQEGIPTSLQGQTFSISTTQETNEDKYNDAFNEYEYEKALYEQTVSDLNAKTEVIQNQDKQLELKLDQLDTERQAINTEIDSVKSVIKDNVEKTFKIFA